MQTPKRVLIVEDEFLVGEKLRGMLEDEGYIVAGDTASGQEAVTMAVRLQPDLVMMDINLPDIDGLTAARRILDRRPIPIVALTAHENPDLVAEAGESGIGYYLVKPAGRREVARAIEIATARFDDLVKLRRLNAALQGEIVERKRAEAALQEALAEAQRREDEMHWLLKASRAVMRCHTFEEAARRIFDVAREATGAVSGYVAMMSADGQENELLFLEAGGLPCEVDPDLPMPIRGLRAQAYTQAAVVYENDFEHSAWMTFIPPKHVAMHNVMFAPLILGDRAVGVMGLANKPGDFTEDDVRMAAALGDMAAIALQRTRIEDELQRSEAFLQTIYDHSPVGIFVVDVMPDGEYVYRSINPAHEAILGVPSDEIAGQSPHALVDLHGEDTVNYILHLYDTCVHEGEPLEVEEHLVWHREPISLLTQITPLEDRDGTIYRLIGTVLDITARKQAEEQLARYAADLERSNQELEQFGYVISHDLRAPLRTVRGYLQLLNQRYANQIDPKAKTYIDHAMNGAARMQEMIQALLDLSRIETRGREPIPTDVEAVLTRTLRALDPMIQETGAAVTHDPLPTVLADEAQLAQVFQNLIANALKFRRGGVPPRVRISASFSPPTNSPPAGVDHPLERGMKGGSADGGEWVFSVTDNGIGLDPDQADRIFQIFQRLHTEDEYEGLGIGLALCQRIIDRHGGRLWVESEPGRGSTFRFTLPEREVRE